MATTTRHDIGSWDNFHNNGPFPTQVLYKTIPAGEASFTSPIERLNDSAEEIQRLLGVASNANQGFRAYGSGWSLSYIAHHHDNMHFNGDMNIKFPIQQSQMHVNSNLAAANLFFFQCGNTIKEISKFLTRQGKSLQATGASNGQTIAGCISTGVHGSAFDVGSVQDFVVGINLITGNQPGDIVYLERASRPALSDNFAQSINARVIRNDDLFNAALVGLGAFGFIHGVIVEAENLFLLNRYVKRIDRNEALRLATTLDFENSTFSIPGEVDDNQKPLRPFHYKLFINPYVNDASVIAEIIYKKPFRQNYPDPVPRMRTAIYRDLIILFGKIASKYKNSIPKLIKALQTSVLPPVDLEAVGTLPEIFWDADHQGPAYACAVGIHHKDAARALEALTSLARNEGPIPGIYGMRFVKKSPALLAPARFDVTCMLEIDGVLWKPKPNKMITLEKFCTRTIEVLKNEGIPFTHHWGKNADWKFPNLVTDIFGQDALTWQQLRSALLRKDMAQLFSNRFLNDVGLAAYHDNLPAGMSRF